MSHQEQRETIRLCPHNHNFLICTYTLSSVPCCLFHSNLQYTVVNDYQSLQSWYIRVVQMQKCCSTKMLHTIAVVLHKNVACTYTVWQWKLCDMLGEDMVHHSTLSEFVSYMEAPSPHLLCGRWLYNCVPVLSSPRISCRGWWVGSRGARKRLGLCGWGSPHDVDRQSLVGGNV